MKPGCRSSIAIPIVLLLVGSVGAQQPTPPTANTNTPAAITSSQSSPAANDSQVRIVRVSDVQGDVQVDRNTGQGFEPALLNLPIVQGTGLRTGAGFAEVEFEDNSTLRLMPDTQVNFSQLELSPSGTRVSTVNVERGMVYVGLTRSTSNEFTLAFGRYKIPLPAPSHVRFDMGDKWANLAVFKGNVHVDAPSGPITVGKNKTITFNLVSPTEPQLIKRVIMWAYDVSDKAATDYHNRRINSSSYGNPPYAYGLPDMRYYGTFINTSDCGRIWRPFFAGAAWDPYGNGAWVWYPGSGYTWVSPYPWGWTPYHYGEWDYCPDYGWGWRPRGVWAGLSNLHKPVYPTRRPPPRPLPVPPKPPGPGGPTVVAVNREPSGSSGLSSPDKFIVRGDSAGLGIPRSTFGNLGHLSPYVAQRGSASISVVSAPISGGSGGQAAPGFAKSSGPGVASRTVGSGYWIARSSGGNYSSGGGRGYSGSGMSRGFSSGGSMSSGGGSGGGGHSGGGGGGGSHR